MCLWICSSAEAWASLLSLLAWVGMEAKATFHVNTKAMVIMGWSRGERIAREIGEEASTNATIMIPLCMFIQLGHDECPAPSTLREGPQPGTASCRHRAGGDFDRAKPGDMAKCSIQHRTDIHPSQIPEHERLRPNLSLRISAQEGASIKSPCRTGLIPGPSSARSSRCAEHCVPLPGYSATTV